MHAGQPLIRAFVTVVPIKRRSIPVEFVHGFIISMAGEVGALCAPMAGRALHAGGHGRQGTACCTCAETMRSAGSRVMMPRQGHTEMHGRAATAAGRMDIGHAHTMRSLCWASQPSLVILLRHQLALAQLREHCFA